MMEFCSQCLVLLIRYDNKKKSSTARNSEKFIYRSNYYKNIQAEKDLQNNITYIDIYT